VVHPSAVSNTKFGDREEMKVNGKKQPMVEKLEKSIAAVTPQ
jgi:hypothetical protein